MNRKNSSHNKGDSSNKIAAFIATLGALLVSVEVLSNFFIIFWLMIIAITNLIVIFYLQISVFSLVTTILFVIFYFIYKKLFAHSKFVEIFSKYNMIITIISLLILNMLYISKKMFNGALITPVVIIITWLIYKFMFKKIKNKKS
ncbi:TPA: hypothetical protein ACGXMA_006239 [Bacillus cereus]|uniref:Membrane protein n=3 Tax=Bacillus cereus TaxID=1396 RepID=A0AAN0SZX2_BACCE|nr:MULTISPECIES: hypothetical protein [Bacillus]MDA1584214.1 hypothetical protein [Bacillus cereus group sp. TH230-1LC]ACO29310.1 conserved hypothetical protein [Bacillus cereus 03BB102]AEW54093.1 Hypothetical protein bcf_04850 [Bacillus cereus F837/76]AJG56341.1 putative membrane protein [Bacillus cereus 03BB102]AJH71194.1 putative membrane protein [Bacillus thuringiensis]